MTRRSKIIGVSVLCAALLALFFFVAQPAQAIDGGEADGAGHPNVGMIGFDVDGPGGPFPPFGLCTAFVVSDSVVVTAAHCIQVNPDASWAMTLAPGSPGAPVVTPGVYPEDFPFPILAPVTYAEDVVMHPSFGEGHAQANDVAVLRFAEGTFAGNTPAALPSEGQLDALAAQGGLLGQDFTLVGYGATHFDRTTKSKQIDGYRQVAHAPYQALTPHSLVLQGTPEASSAGYVCSGDSGGPQFVGDSNLAVSLVGGITNSSHLCGTGARFVQRLDTPIVQQFLGQFIALP